MDIYAIARIDRWVGMPLCWALTLARRARGLVRTEKLPDASPRRICFIKLIEQGSTVLAASTLRRAVDVVGAENVFFVVFADNRAILDVLGIVPPENVVAIQARSPAGLALGVASAVRRLRGLRLDATIDLEFFARGTAALAYLSGAPRRVGHHRFRNAGGRRGDLLTHRVQYNPYVHASQAFALLLDVLLDDDVVTRPLAKRPPPSVAPWQPAASPSREDVAAATALLERVGVSPAAHRVVILNPNASDLIPLRKWPRARYAELGRRLLAHDPSVRVVVTGTEAERDNARAVVEAIGSPAATSLAGETTLPRLLALYSLARLLVTNDSGPAQFASLTSLDTIVLFGPETPRLYAPLSPRAVVLSAGLSCSPCLNVFNHRQSPCDDNACMREITVDQVLRAAVRLLDGSSP